MKGMLDNPSARTTSLFSEAPRTGNSVDKSRISLQRDERVEKISTFDSDFLEKDTTEMAMKPDLLQDVSITMSQVSLASGAEVPPPPRKI
jgi:hypothetical protein